MSRYLSLFFCLFCTTGMAATRPYEMEWAGRNQDDRPPTLALTDPSGWRVETKNAVASFTKSKELLLFGDGVCQLTYRATGANPVVKLSPPAPVNVPHEVDAVTCWIYGNNHSYAPTPKIPPVTVHAHFIDKDNRPLSIVLEKIRYKEWFLCHKRFNAEDLPRLKKGITFCSFTITGGTNREDQQIAFNSLALFKEPLQPLSFKKRPQRYFQLFSKQPQGVNTREDRLPFPNTPLTVIPPDPTPAIFRVGKSQSGRFFLVRDGEDGHLEICLPEQAGTWDAMRFRWNQSPWVSFAKGSGIYFSDVGKRSSLFRADRESLTTSSDGKSVVYQAVLYQKEKVLSHVHIRFSLVGKSLVLDLQADGGKVAEVHFGKILPPNPFQIIPIPYYTYQRGITGRPSILATALENRPFFHSATLDWTQSSASEPFAQCVMRTPQDSISINGGVRYFAKTDGIRNACFERFVYTFSPVFEETLPNIPNPTSPWKKITGSHVWRVHHASNRDRDADYWRLRRRWGLKKLLIADHESGWRDGNESFTFRTEPAPKKGGAEGQYQYARILQDELGYLYGPYNNFTDFAPVNQYWHPDMITRDRNNQMRRAWDRCYAPKPTRSVEFCERLTPIIQNKFHFSTGYCDVHTCVSPWSRCEYDARVPGAGTFTSTFYAFGEILLLQRKGWNGPVYSEGGCHFLYCGLSDGNYAQDQEYRISENPWLVDFDLRRMHPLCCNFGMGYPNMFYPHRSAPKDPVVASDRFLAATVAFGHPGFLLFGLDEELKSYYMIQPIAAKYTQANADQIRYADPDGVLHDTSSAIANGCFKQSQIITRYTDGTITRVNGSMEHSLKTEWDGKTILLPPNGYCGISGDKTVRVFSGDIHGKRADYAISPDAIYLNGRGTFVQIAEGGCDGVLIRLPEPNLGTEEILIRNASEVVLPYSVSKIIALDRNWKSGKEISFSIVKGKTRFSPLREAFSYRAYPMK